MYTTHFAIVPICHIVPFKFGLLFLRPTILELWDTEDGVGTRQKKLSKHPSVLFCPRQVTNVGLFSLKLVPTRFVYLGGGLGATGTHLSQDPKKTGTQKNLSREA